MVVVVEVLVVVEVGHCEPKIRSMRLPQDTVGINYEWSSSNSEFANDYNLHYQKNLIIGQNSPHSMSGNLKYLRMCKLGSSQWPKGAAKVQ